MPAAASTSRLVAAIQRDISGTRRGWKRSPLRDVSMCATRQSVRSRSPLGSIAATTFWLRRRDSACEIGARSSDPSLASPRAAPAAGNIRANLRERGTSAGARASARMIENGAAKVA